MKILLLVIDVPFDMTLCSIFIVSTLFTTVGGIKAVLWTDVFFGIVMLSIQIIIITISFSNISNFSQTIFSEAT